MRGHPRKSQNEEKGGGLLELEKRIKTVTEAFKEEMIEHIESEENEERKRVLQRALDRGMELLEGRQ
jgi:DNA-binding MarR family transcriptional regulator